MYLHSQEPTSQKQKPYYVLDMAWGESAACHMAGIYLHKVNTYQIAVTQHSIISPSRSRGGGGGVVTDSLYARLEDWPSDTIDLLQ